MLLFNRPLDLSKIRTFPSDNWDEAVSGDWEQWCNQLQEWKPPKITLTVKHPERKWEMVSAYQKSVRRGMEEMALKLTGAFLSFDPKEHAYFWRRICTTACEDVGYANPDLMNFVIVCSMHYSSVKVPKETKYHVWSYLTHQMCQSRRSRIYCQFSVIEGLANAKILPEHISVPVESFLVEEILSPNTITKKLLWAEKNNWRGEGMLHFQDILLGEEQHSMELFEHQMLAGLPDFTYDMHTRVGKAVTFRLSGRLKETLEGANDKAKAVGWALFLAEGGRITNEITHQVLCSLEEKFIAAKFGVPLSQWNEIYKKVWMALHDGTVNELRTQEILKQKYL